LAQDIYKSVTNSPPYLYTLLLFYHYFGNPIFHSFKSIISIIFTWGVTTVEPLYMVITIDE